MCRTIFLQHDFRRSLLSKTTATVPDSRPFPHPSVLMHLPANLRPRQISMNVTHLVGTFSRRTIPMYRKTLASTERVGQHDLVGPLGRRGGSNWGPTPFWAKMGPHPRPQLSWRRFIPARRGGTFHLAVPKVSNQSNTKGSRLI